MIKGMLKISGRGEYTLLDKLDENRKARLRAEGLIGTVPIKRFEEASVNVCACLFNQLMFFFPVLMKGDYANYRKENKHSSQQEDNSKFIHSYSPLSRIVAQMKQPIKNIMPVKKIIKRNFCSETSCPKTTTARINLPTSKIFLLKFSLCFFVNLIDEILSKAKLLVKSPSISPLSRGRSPKDRRGCVLKDE